MTTATTKVRNFYIDNAKGILIFLVVLGHFTYGTNAIPVELKWLIYSFHMPAFFLVAGFFEKKKTWAKTGKEIIYYTLVPMIVYHSIQNIVRVLFLDRHPNLDYWFPNYTLWFLVALAMFKIVIQLIIRYPFLLLLLPVNFLLYDFYIENPKILVIGRASYFVLFFVLGYYTKLYYAQLLNKLNFLKSYRTRLLIGSLIFLLIIVLRQIDSIELVGMASLQGKFYLLANYPTFTLTDLLSVKMGALLFQLLMLIAFFLLVPTEENFMTKYGNLTMPIYLNHGIVKLILFSTPVISNTDHIGTIFMSVSISVILMYATTRRPLIDFLNFIMRK